MSVFIFALLCLYIVNADDICTKSSACVTTRCPGCSVFTTAFFQTNSQTKTTFIAFNVSNQCEKSAAKPGVIFVAFNLNSPSQGLTLTPSITSGTYQGANYQWSVSTGAPDGTDALPAPKPTNYLKFTATGAGVVNGHQTKMSLAAGNLNYDIFRFSVTGYDPTYNWVFRFHYADQYEAHGYIDISNCQCDSCDSNHQKRVVQQCTLGYPDGSSSRASTIFNEDLILYSFAATNNINNVGANLISLYYSDEYPLMLGIDRIVEGGQTTMAPTPPAFSAVPQAPTCIGINGPINFGFPVDNPKVKTASVDNSGTANQCNPGVQPVYTCPRPLPPSLFLTDITDNPAARSGDWQQNGTAYLPQKICGLYYYSRKNVNGVAADGTVTADILGFQSISGLTLPPTNSLGGLLPPWVFGEGSDPIPVFAPTNPATNRFEYGTQVAWDVAKLPLRDARNYRFQIMAHDGDSTKVGGDIGEACVNIIVQCDAGFVNKPGDATPCSSCDLTPLPGDGKWTWFASPATVPLPGPDSPLANVYILTKIPKSKLTQEPYKTYLADGTGFIPGPGVIDKAGFAITCDAKRIIKPCPLNCCGNGKCDYTKGVCQCFGPPEGLLDTNTCCPTNAPTKTPTVAPTSTGAPTVFLQPTSAPTPPTEAPTTTPCFNNGAGCINGVCIVALDKCNCSDPAFLQPDCRPPPCFNNGRYCNGNGACINETCVCNDPAFLPPDCSAPPPPQPKCTDIISSNNIDCKICVDDPIAKQLGCVYCPPPGNRTDPLVGGTCVSANACSKPAASCQPVVVTIPPQCADNCSGNGICVNLTYCRQLEIENKAKYGNNTDQYPLNCGENANKSQSYNQTGACACYPGFTGFNCGLVGSKTLVALAALGAGLIALIVIMALLGAAMCGGGAVAVSQGVTSDASGTVISSPLYESSAGSGTNPLATEAYELF